MGISQGLYVMGISQGLYVTGISQGLCVMGLVCDGYIPRLVCDGYIPRLVCDGISQGLYVMGYPKACMWRVYPEAIYYVLWVYPRLYVMCYGYSPRLYVMCYGYTQGYMLCRPVARILRRGVIKDRTHYHTGFFALQMWCDRWFDMMVIQSWRYIIRKDSAFFFDSVSHEAVQKLSLNVSKNWKLSQIFRLKKN